MKKKDKDYSSLSVLIGVVVALFFHWLLLSDVDLHPTIHAGIGGGFFFVLIAAINSVLSKIW